MTLLMAALVAIAGPLFEQPAADAPNLTGKWAMTPRITHLLTSDGKEPPLVRR